MSYIRIFFICVANILICINIGFAQNNDAYMISDFIESGLFPNQYGYMCQDSSCLDYSAIDEFPASFDRIQAAFPGAVNRYYEHAPEFRKYVFGYIPSESASVPLCFENENLFYSYWIASDGIFCVIWEEAFIGKGIDFAAGKSFYFNLPPKQVTVPHNGQTVYEMIDNLGLVFSVDNIILPNQILRFTVQFKRIIYGLFTPEGLTLKCCLVGPDEHFLFDLTPLAKHNLKHIQDYVNATENLSY